MNSRAAVFFSGAGEGPLDQIVIERLAEFTGANVGPIYGGSGKPALLDRLEGYNAAARHAPWIVLVDLNGDCECAPIALQNWLPYPEPLMCFRIVVRAIESWLLADRERLASTLRVAKSRIPINPESLENPKRTIVEIARRSRSRDVREDMVPRDGSGRNVGPAYTSRLMDFVRDSETGWRPNIAASASDSLSRCLQCLQPIIQLPA